MKKIVFPLLGFCSFFFFVGCSDNSTPTPDSKDPTEFTVTYKSDASTEVGTQKVSQVTPTLTKDNFAIDGKYMVGFFSDEAKNTAFSFPKDLTGNITIYVTSAKDVVTPADKAALVTEVDKAITEQGNNADLNYINTEKVTDMSNSFINQPDFNGDVSLWNVSKVESMEFLFQFLPKFNGDISKWNVSAVKNMTQIFQGATAFNGDISNWNVSAVTSMDFMFGNASNFNGDISNWNVSAVTSMAFMFSGASVFNQDISSWDVSGVDNMSNIFRSASAFNQNISTWDVSALINARAMFENATAFDQDLDPWKEHLPLEDNKFTSSDFSFSKDDMFKGSPLQDNPPSWY